MSCGKILVVEGDITLGEKMADKLQEEAFQARAVSTGEDAIEILKGEWIDLVVLAIKLRGEMDGFHLLKAIKEDSALSGTPVIVESDKPGLKDVFRQMGVKAFFVKPVSLDDIIGKVKEMLG